MHNNKEPFCTAVNGNFSLFGPIKWEDETRKVSPPAINAITYNITVLEVAG